MTDVEKEKDEPESESEPRTTPHIVSNAKASTGEEGASVFGFEPQPMNSAAADVAQEKEKEPVREDSKEEKAENSPSASHQIISDGRSAK
jgi:hypothetical protein